MKTTTGLPQQRAAAVPSHPNNGVATVEQAARGPVPIDAHLLQLIGGGAPRGGWNAGEQLSTEAPRGGW